jgi:hypothetical protein
MLEPLNFPEAATVFADPMAVYLDDGMNTIALDGLNDP